MHSAQLPITLNMPGPCEHALTKIDRVAEIVFRVSKSLWQISSRASYVRLAFRQCARQYKRNAYRHLSSSQLVYFRASRAGQSPKAQNSQRKSRPDTSSKQTNNTTSATDVRVTNSSPASTHSQQSRDLIPRRRDGRAVDTGRTVDAPMKIIPKADLTANLRLTPRERLHIEVLTRRAPPVVKQVKPYKERLLIYHHGNLTENALIFLKVLTLLCAGVVTLVVVPAHYSAGSPLWLCGSLFLGGIFPSLFFHRLLKPLVTRIHLRLPPNARVSPDAAMKYAKHLPVSAALDVSFMRITALPGTVMVNVADLQPILRRSGWLRKIANVRWVGPHVDKGTRLRSNPTEFLIKPSVGAGRARRDVIPGIWPEVYNRLMGVTGEQTARWKRS